MPSWSPTTREDFTRNQKRYDLILDIAGRPSLLGCRRSLKPGGRLVLIGGEGGRWLGPLPRMARALALGLPDSRKVRAFESKENRKDTLVLAGLLAAGDLRSVIDRTYDLAAAPEAVDYLAEGHTQGKGRDRLTHPTQTPTRIPPAARRASGGSHGGRTRVPDAPPVRCAVPHIVARLVTTLAGGLLITGARWPMILCVDAAHSR